MTDEFREPLDRIEGTARELSRLIGQNRSIGNATVNANIQAGGVGIWISTTCCCVMLGVLVIGSFWVTREFNRLDADMRDRKEENTRMQSFVSAIYVQAPQLRPADLKEKDNAKKQ